MKKLITLFLVTFMLATIFAGCWNEKIAEISTTTTGESTTATYPVSVPNETESTEPVTEPTVTSSEPVTEATEPSETESTEPATEVTEPSETEVTEPVVESTETEPVVEPTDPVTEPTQTVPPTETTEVPVITEPVVTEPPITEPVMTEPPTEVTVAPTESTVTEPVVTDPPATEPVVTEPPTEVTVAPTESTVTEPVVTDPPATEPVVTEPPTEATTVPTEPPHVHEYVKKVVAPTCTKKGYTLHTCDCGDSFKDSETKATGHKFSNYISNDDATCEQDGTKTAVCENGCGDASTVPDIGSATGHDYTKAVAKPSCTDSGFSVFTCSVCGNSYRDEFVPALGHTYTEIVTVPTCTDKGYTTKTCSTCDTKIVTNQTPALGHNYTKTVVSCTCTENGYTTFLCENCGNTYTDNFEAALGHNYQPTVISATCVEDGYTVYRCANCDDSYTADIVVAQGHDIITTDFPSTCIQAGYLLNECCNCEYAVIIENYELAEHPFQETIIEADCINDGYSLFHCSYCGYEYTDGAIPALGHNYIVTTTNATCLTDGYDDYKCERCGDNYQTVIPAVGQHNWGDWEISLLPKEDKEGKETRTCLNCSLTESKPIEKLPPSPLQWYALGDSITEGYYGYFDENDSHGMGSWFGYDRKNCWAAVAAVQNEWKLTNLGVGGSGFVAVGTSPIKTSGRERVANSDFSEADLVTIMYGINDWKYGHPLGTFDDDMEEGGTFYSNMRWCIEKILQDNPDVKIVVLSPLNAYRQVGTRFGTYEGYYALSHTISKNGCTLEDFFRAEQEICQYYGLEFVDMTHDETIVNRDNIIEVLPDGVHPSRECHAALGAYIAEILKKFIK